MEYVRSHYGVPAFRGQAVEVDGRQGVITGSDGQYLRVRLDGEKHSVRAHPTWRVRYLDAAQEQGCGNV
ncbi:hypothetical protein [Mycolicibacillus koreensis]|nr:hypothetical protein [Mycolicibacillus koreensis]